MKINYIRIQGYQQFEDLFLDFRNPSTGKVAERICFIGRNGTGKSTLLEILNRFLRVRNALQGHFQNIYIKVTTANKDLIYFYEQVQETIE